MQNGWVKIHRKIQEKCYYRKSAYVHLWIHLLLSANNRQNEFMWNGNIILVKEGQLITGRKQLSLETGIPESTVEDILVFLEKQHQIQQQKNNKFRLITIVNWIKHQRQATTKATTQQQQADTNKNIKKDKKYIAETSSAEEVLPKKKNKKKDFDDPTPMLLPEFQIYCQKSPCRHIHIIGNYADEKKLDFKTKGQWLAFIDRNLRPARNLAPYDDNQISQAMASLEKNIKKPGVRGGYITKWTLETLAGYLDDNGI